MPNDWPTSGDITFEDYEVRYREGLDLVLKGISLNIRSGEKVFNLQINKRYDYSFLTIVNKYVLRK